MESENKKFDRSKYAIFDLLIDDAADEDDEDDGLYRYEEGNIYIVSSEPIEQATSDELKKDFEKGAVNRFRENPNRIADYCGETPLEEYIGKVEK